MKYSTLSLVLAIVQLQPSYGDHEGDTVLVKSWEDVRTNFSVPLMKETDFLYKPEENIELRTRYTFCSIANILQNSNISVLVNEEPEENAVIQGNMVNLTGLDSIKLGLNNIMFEIVTNYTLTSNYIAHFECSRKLNDVQIFTTHIKHYMHLYVFDAPSLTNINGTLVCNLQSSGVRRYSDFIVSFIREYSERNTTEYVTVGHCLSNDLYPMNHHGMKIHYNDTTECCVMELPNMISQQDTGIYYCYVQIRTAESNEVTSLASNAESIKLHNNEVLLIAGSASGGVVLILIATLLVILLVTVYKNRRPNQQQRNGYEQIRGHDNPNRRSPSPPPLPPPRDRSPQLSPSPPPLPPPRSPRLSPSPPPQLSPSPPPLAPPRDRSPRLSPSPSLSLPLQSPRISPTPYLSPARLPLSSPSLSPSPLPSLSPSPLPSLSPSPLPSLSLPPPPSPPFLQLSLPQISPYSDTHPVEWLNVGEHAGTPSPVTEAGSHHMHDQTSLPHIHYESFVISEHSQETSSSSDADPKTTSPSEGESDSTKPSLSSNAGENCDNSPAEGHDSLQQPNSINTAPGSSGKENLSLMSSGTNVTNSPLEDSDHPPLPSLNSAPNTLQSIQGEPSSGDNAAAAANNQGESSDSQRKPPSENTALSLPSTLEAEKPRKKSAVDHRNQHPSYEVPKSSSSDECQGRDQRRKSRGKRKKSAGDT